MTPAFQDTAADPVVIIGAGPIGLAAAAHLARRGVPFLLLEAGATVAASVRAWGHVQLFTPWRYNIDKEAAALLEETDWTVPSPSEACPTGAQLIEAYLDPLSRHPRIAPFLRLEHRVRAIARDERGKLEHDRADELFMVVVDTPVGERILHAGAIIDASGTWTQPNPMGGNGLRVEGEARYADHIRYGIPDVLGSERSRYLGKRTLVVGSGHSALNALEALAMLRGEDSSTKVLWALRGDGWSESSCDDQVLTERNLLRREIRALIASDEIESYTGVRIARIEAHDDGLVATTRAGQLPAVDEFIVTTGFRPDLSLERELRLDVHPIFESTFALADLIDPSSAACGTVTPHGVRRLAHPEPDFFIVGMKSYGRAPTFLLLTGYEQVRSVVCAICGDEAALEVQLTLPDRGLCSACTAFRDEQEARHAAEDGCACDPDDGISSDALCCDDTEIAIPT